MYYVKHIAVAVGGEQAGDTSPCEKQLSRGGFVIMFCYRPRAECTGRKRNWNTMNLVILIRAGVPAWSHSFFADVSEPQLIHLDPTGATTMFPAHWAAANKDNFATCIKITRSDFT